MSLKLKLIDDPAKLIEQLINLNHVHFIFVANIEFEYHEQIHTWLTEQGRVMKDRMTEILHRLAELNVDVARIVGGPNRKDGSTSSE